MFKRFLSDWLGWVEASCSLPSEAGTVAQALSTLDAHGIRAHDYASTLDCNNAELRQALRFLAARGYVMTDRDGVVIGLPAVSRPPLRREREDLKRQMVVIRSNPAPRHQARPVLEEAMVSSS